MNDALNAYKSQLKSKIEIFETKIKVPKALYSIIEKPLNDLDIEEVNLAIDKLSKMEIVYNKIALKKPEFPKELETNTYKNVKFMWRELFLDVFRAEKNGNPTIIKIPVYHNEEIIDALINQLAQWKKLNHKNIAKLYSYNTNPIPYFEMEAYNVGGYTKTHRPRVGSIYNVKYL